MKASIMYLWIKRPHTGDFLNLNFILLADYMLKRNLGYKCYKKDTICDYEFKIMAISQVVVVI